MPRRGVQPAVAAPLPPPPPSPNVQRLRQDWRWAGISQFVWTFSDAFGLVDWDIETLEHDFDGTETQVIPDLIAKMLYALTWNRQINRDNAFEHLHKQWLKRNPETNPFGSLDEPITWHALGLSQKVEALWQLTEWQLADPTRLRSLLKTEDDPASWRVDPVGWDKAGNTYYLFDDNRLWVQRPRPQPPRPPKTTSIKAKRSQRSVKRSDVSSTKSHKKSAPKEIATAEPDVMSEETVSGPRKRTQVKFYGNVTPTVEALRRGGPLPPTPRSSRTTRSSARTGPVPTSTFSPLNSPSQPPPLPRGTRVSRRLRNVDDEWQQIPDEWLQPTTKSRAVEQIASESAALKLADGDESDLSDLTDEEEHQAELQATQAARMDRPKEDSPLSEPPEPSTPPDIPVDVADDAYHSEPGDVDQEEEPGRDSSGEFVKEDPDEVVAHEPEGHAKIDASIDEGTTLSKTSNELLNFEGGPLDTDITSANEGAVDENADKDVKTITCLAGPSDGAVAADQEAVKVEEPTERDEVKLAAREAASVPAGFIEWEAVCVTLYDWRTWPEQFAKSRDPDEKALYKLLVNDVAPQIIEGLMAKEQERLKQEAINNRKRSSRIATRELAREEELRREQAQREMEERMERVRQEEAARERAQAEDLAREQRREARLREREERLASREAAILARAEAEAMERERAERRRERRKRRRDGEDIESSSEDGTSSRPLTRPQTPNMGDNSLGQDASSAQSWELKCEVCKRQGWNLSDDDDVVCCDDCGRWQHVKCHDRKDLAAGFGIRDWDKVDFRCSECEARKSKRPRVENIAPPQANGGRQHVPPENGSSGALGSSHASITSREDTHVPRTHGYHPLHALPNPQHQHPSQGFPHAANGNPLRPVAVSQHVAAFSHVQHSHHQRQYLQDSHHLPSPTLSHHPHTSPQARYHSTPQPAPPFAHRADQPSLGHISPHPGSRMPLYSEPHLQQGQPFRPVFAAYQRETRDPRVDHPLGPHRQQPQQPQPGVTFHRDYSMPNGDGHVPQHYGYHNTSPTSQTHPMPPQPMP
ncbi:hypothetical protein CC85DRAFT_194526 [Cutaneotrichosporon oleaginosum]|uniref:PHD-type domain-containing protein n=1 Tax=Cutaneotrichosporon oleaginosum TaxID=879819 RepID=A0A0J0XEL6_9TREE|nr:uncharacterized protein CC85DRAFT_194526 [Cutaneotrichosporon oleaginosum]KLT39506.1 hypothetical protein CC85DRAFT_194526 [Cutaneotrichosporon oleaginosum]TXT06830.1 hypothetical protein COLE_06161 [Cutaneotrichosporon oleaginosum]